MKLLIMTCLTLATASLALAGSATPPYAAVVSVDSAAARPGEAVTLAVRLSGNDQNISAAIIPLKYEPSVLTLDSVSFDPSFLPDGINGYYNTDVSAKEIRIVYVPDFNKIPIDTITASSGVLAFLHFRVAPSAAPQFSTVDSINFDTVININGSDTTHLTLQVEFADNTGSGIYHPGFESGGVLVLVPTGVDESETDALPGAYALNQNYPNPFNPATVIGFDLPQSGQARLEVFNLLGQSVAVLADGRFGAGIHQVAFSADNLPSGIYFYRLTHDAGSMTRKMILLK
jgi:hypothetical protein